MEGEHRTLPKRWWTAENAETVLPTASPYKLRHKPDMVLTNYVGGKTTLTEGNRTPWSNVLALCETSMTSYRKNTTMPGTMEEKSYIMQMEQDDRCFTPAIGFAGDTFTLQVFNREGTQSFDTRITHNGSLKRILCVLGSLFFGQPATIGYNETMKCKDGRLIEIAQEGEW